MAAQPKHKPELAPCPFCGCRLLTERVYKCRPIAIVYCNVCGAQGPNGRALLRRMGAEAWNDRDTAHDTSRQNQTKP